MSVYTTITSARSTIPDWPSLVAAVRGAVDATAGVVQRTPTTYLVKTAAALTGPQLTAVQAAIDTTPATSPQLTAQAEIDRLGIREKAILLALIDQLNVIRSKLAPPLGAITPAQAIQAARDKAATL